MVTSLTTGHCAPHRGPAHHSIQRTVVILPLARQDGFRSPGSRRSIANSATSRIDRRTIAHRAIPRYILRYIYICIYFSLVALSVKFSLIYVLAYAIRHYVARYDHDAVVILPIIALCIVDFRGAIATPASETTPAVHRTRSRAHPAQSLSAIIAIVNLERFRIPGTTSRTPPRVIVPSLAATDRGSRIRLGVRRHPESRSAARAQPRAIAQPSTLTLTLTPRSPAFIRLSNRDTPRRGAPRRRPAEQGHASTSVDPHRGFSSRSVDLHRV